MRRPTVTAAFAALVLACTVAFLPPVAGERREPAEPKKSERSGEGKDEAASRTERKTAEDADPSGEGKPIASDGDERPLVITNEILEQRYGGAGGGAVVTGTVREGTGPAAPEAGLPEDALEALQDREARKRNRDALIAETDRRIAALEGRIEDLERRELAIRNPFLPRPKVPEDQAEDWAKRTPAERIEITRREIEQARRELEALRERRSRLEAIAG